MKVGKKIRNKKEIKKIIEENEKQKVKTRDIKDQSYYVTDVTTLPIHEKERIDFEYERANSYVNLKEEKLEEQFKNKEGNLKKVGDFLYNYLYDNAMVSKMEVARKLHISIANVNDKISKLNFYSGYPLTIIPVCGKKNFVQAITNSEADSISWEGKKFRTIESMQHTKDKGELLMKKLRKVKNKQKQKVKIMVKQK